MVVGLGKEIAVSHMVFEMAQGCSLVVGVQDGPGVVGLLVRWPGAVGLLVHWPGTVGPEDDQCGGRELPWDAERRPWTGGI